LQDHFRHVKQFWEESIELEELAECL
jgi:hypothetical protein